MTSVPKTVTLVGVYRFPVPLGVTQGSLGKTFAVEIAGISGKATFPTLAWSDSEPRLVMPPLDDPLPRAIDHYTKHEEPSTRWTYWGFASKCIPDRFRQRLRRVVDDLAVADRCVAGAEAEQRLKRGMRVPAAVVSKDELVQIGLKVPS
jgi:hypothetical protein